MKQHPPAPAETEAESESASALIDAKIQELGDWRGEMLARLRALIKEADPEVVVSVSPAPSRRCERKLPE